MVLLVLMLSAGTGGKDTTSGGVLKAGDKELRTDLGPLVKRFPILAEAPGAQWTGGTLGGW